MRWLNLAADVGDFSFEPGDFLRKLLDGRGLRAIEGEVNFRRAEVLASLFQLRFAQFVGLLFGRETGGVVIDDDLARQALLLRRGAVKQMDDHSAPAKA